MSTCRASTRSRPPSRVSSHPEGTAGEGGQTVARAGSRTGGRDIDLRVSVLPTVYGESIVMRILDKEGLKLGLPELGFFADDQAKFQGLISGSDGVFLVTGPTGSGKSTALASTIGAGNIVGVASAVAERSSAIAAASSSSRPVARSWCWCPA